MAKAEHAPSDEPFATFSEWTSENDRRAYGQLSAPVRDVLKTVLQNLETFVAWPQRAILLWRGCVRVWPRGQKKFHEYPGPLKKKLAQEKRGSLDNKSNGPAVEAYLLAKGQIPPRSSGPKKVWPIHHLYDGKFPYPGREVTLHAVKYGCHFTQSAGLVAAHPIADALCDEFPLFAWRLRAEAFKRFGYDPDKVFRKRHDEFGFADGKHCTVIHDGTRKREQR